MTIMWLVAYWGGLLMSFVNPVYGVLVYLLEYYARPSLHYWGLMLPDLRWSLLASMVVLVTYHMRKSSLPTLPETSTPPLKWMLAMLLLMMTITLFAVSMPESWDKTVIFFKFICLCVVFLGIMRTRGAVDAFIAAHMAGAAWWGWNQFLNPKRAASRLVEVGSSDTLNDNLASCHLLTVIPFIFILLFTAKDKRLRLVALVSAPLVLNLFILCNSRGGMVGMVAASLAALVFVGSGRRLRLVGGIVAAAALLLFLADPEFIARQMTTLHYKDQGTAVERMSSWQGGFAMMQAYPFGAGGDGFEQLSTRYLGEIASEGQRAPHNTYVLIATEWGLLGLIMYFGLIGSTFMVLRKVRKRAVKGDWFCNRALAIQIGLVGTLVASTFADRLYGESFYWMVTLAMVLYRLQEGELTASAPEKAPEPAPAQPARPRVLVRTPSPA